MSKIKHSGATKRRKKRVLAQAKGFRLKRSKQFQQARRALAHALTYAFRDRKKRKIEFRQIWIVRINALCRQEGIAYSRFISALKKNKVALDRKSLATIAVSDESTFKKLIEFAKK
ncbi:MAG: 50S ribosomal protein L20 [Candidatus Omnitrophota bacterium]